MVESTEKMTLDTPTLSDAEADTVMEPETVELAAGEVRFTEGLVVSTDVGVVVDTVLDLDDIFPAVSYAVT